MSEVITDKRERPASAVISIIVAILTGGYMLPWMIAALRGKSNAWPIFWLNLLLVWCLPLACLAGAAAMFLRRRA